MTTYNDVFTAILAMDSYHRNANQGVFFDTPEAILGQKGQQIGSVKIIDYKLVRENSFYAIAYQYTNDVFDEDGTLLHKQDEIIISYRGTDEIKFLDGNADIWQGWAVGAGVNHNNQAGAAIDFYEQVVKQVAQEKGVTLSQDFNIFHKIPEGLPAISLTGHSLGGGLAGFVASLARNDVGDNLKALIFDHMPFGIAANITYAMELAVEICNSQAACDLLGIAKLGPSESLLQKLNAVSVVNSAFNGISDELKHQVIEAVGMADGPKWANNTYGYYLEGEVNQGLRNGLIAAGIGGGLGGLLNAVGLPQVGVLLNLVGAYLAYEMPFQEVNVPKQSFDVGNVGLGLPIVNQLALHSMALLTIVMDAKIVNRVMMVG